MGKKVIHLKKEDVCIEKEPLQQGNKMYVEFQESVFLQGAEKAFSMVLRAYYLREEKVLRQLVRSDLVQKFLFQHTSSQDVPEIQVLSAHIKSKDVKGKTAWVVVRFVSLQKRGTQEEELEDLWTFERDLTSSNPNWIVSAIDFHNHLDESKSGSIDPPLS